MGENKTRGEIKIKKRKKEEKKKEKRHCWSFSKIYKMLFVSKREQFMLHVVVGDFEKYM